MYWTYRQISAVVFPRCIILLHYFCKGCKNCVVFSWMKKKNNILLSASLFGAPQYCKTFVFFLFFFATVIKKNIGKNGTIWRPSLQYMRPYPVGLTFSTKKKKIQFHFYSVFAHSVVGWSRQLTILWRNLSFIDCKNLARGWQKDTDWFVYLLARGHGPSNEATTAIVIYAIQRYIYLSVWVVYRRTVESVSTHFERHQIDLIDIISRVPYNKIVSFILP